jgi:hypothetical protein
MMRWPLHTVVVTILILCATRLSAHDEFRIIGTISKLQDSQLQVKTKDSKTYSVKLDAETYIHLDDKQKEKIKATELKTGRSVVVGALGDSEVDLLALEVRIVPTIGK